MRFHSDRGGGDRSSRRHRRLAHFLPKAGRQIRGQNAAQAQFAQQRDDLACLSRCQCPDRCRYQQDLLGLNRPDAATIAMGNFPDFGPAINSRSAQGLRGVDAGAAANGLLRSGATLESRTDLRHCGLADQEFT